MNIEFFISGLSDSFSLTNVTEIRDCAEGREPVILRGPEMRKLTIHPNHSYTITSDGTVYVFSGAFLQLVEFPLRD